MGKSRKIIDNFVENLKTTINQPDIVYEKYRELPEDLEPRQDIKRLRVALYVSSEDDITKVGAEKPGDSRQSYSMDISVVRAYRGEKAENHELVALDLKDAVVDWVKDLDAYTVSNGSISSFGYDGATEFTRRKRYATMTLRFSGQKDLIIQQST